MGTGRDKTTEPDLPWAGLESSHEPEALAALIAPYLLRCETEAAAKVSLAALGPAAVATLIRLANDDLRYLGPVDEGPFLASPSGAAAVLELIHGVDSAAVIRLCEPRIKSIDYRVRMVIAEALARCGTMGGRTLLQHLAHDPVPDVRKALIIAVEKYASIAGGKEGNRQAAAGMLYDLLVGIAKEFPTDSPPELYRAIANIDSGRAVAEMLENAWISYDHPSFGEWIFALEQAEAIVPRTFIERQLALASSKPLAVRASGGWEVPSYDAINLGILLKLLAHSEKTEAREDLTRWSRHDNKLVRTAAIEGLARISGLGRIRRLLQGDVERLAGHQRLVALALEFEDEIANGGLEQFLFNGYGNHCQETLAALAELECRSAIAFVEESAAVIGQNALAASGEAREAALSGLGPEDHLKLDRLLVRYFGADESIELQAWRFAMGHPAHFTEVALAAAEVGAAGGTG